MISDRGEVMTRYDERMLSNTKITYMYSPGSAPITFEVDGMRFGCALSPRIREARVARKLLAARSGTLHAPLRRREATPAVITDHLSHRRARSRKQKPSPLSGRAGTAS